MCCSHSPSPTGTNGTDVRRSLPWARTIRLQQLYQLLSLLCVFSTLGNLLFSKLTNPNGMKTSDSGTLLSQGTRLRGADACPHRWLALAERANLLAEYANEPQRVGCLHPNEIAASQIGSQKQRSEGRVAQRKKVRARGQRVRMVRRTSNCGDPGIPCPHPHLVDQCECLGTPVSLNIIRKVERSQVFSCGSGV
jgi:hypothetical protein